MDNNKGHTALPPTSETEFWAPDGQMDGEKYNPDTRGAATYPVHGNFKIIGQQIVCTLCENQHTLPLDINKYDILDGKIVKRLTRAGTI